MLDDQATTLSSATSGARPRLSATAASLAAAVLLAASPGWAGPSDAETLEAMGFGSLLEGEKVESASVKPIAILGLDHEQRTGATVIGIVGEEPLLAHTVYSRGADELVLEVSGVDVSRLRSVAEVGTSEVARVAVEDDGSGRARFTVTRSPDTRHSVAVDPTDPRRLTLTITSLAGGATRGDGGARATASSSARERATVLASRETGNDLGRPAGRVEQAAASPRHTSAAAGTSAARLLDAQVTKAADGRVMLRLVGSRALKARPFTLDNPPRLVVDLPMTSSAVPEPRLAVPGSGVLGVRISQNQPMPSPLTRIVVDLEETTAWEVIPGPDALVVALGEGPSVFGASASMARSTPPSAPSAPSSPPAVTSAAAAGDRAPLVTTARVGADSASALGRPSTFAGGPAPEAFSGRPAPAGEPLRETQASVGGALADSPLLDSGGRSGGSFETVTIGESGPVYAGEPISINLKGADLEDLFRLFAEVADLNIILDPSVRGKQMTLVLDEVPWDQALALVLKTQNLGSSLEGNVLRVAPLQKLAQEEQQKKQLEEARELSGALTSIARTLSYASSQAAEQIVNESLSARGSIVTDRRTNTLIIKDLEDRMPEIESLLDLIDQPTQQVMIEARIVETTQDFTKGWGIQWGFNYIADRAFGNQTGFSFPRSIAADYAVNLPVSGATSSLGLAFRNILNTFALDIAISALEDRGRARIISRPMVMVQNNEEAEIESGVQIPITTTTATEIDVTFVSASLALTVTPQITADDNVIMEIEVENNQPVFLSGVSEQASIATRQASTVVRVPNGGTTVIGGIYQVNEGVSSSRTPFLSRIPLLGWLFRNKRIDRTNDELLIFLTPRIQED